MGALILAVAGALAVIGLAVAALAYALRPRRKTYATPANLRCPNCQSDGPFAAVSTLWEACVELDALVRREAGYRLACQRCPQTFTVSVNGVFVQHPEALPWTPQIGKAKRAPAHDGAVAEAAEEPENSPFPAPQPRLTPKPKPRV